MPYSGYGLQLAPGDALSIDINNLNKIRVFAQISGDKVSYLGIAH